MLAVLLGFQHYYGHPTPLGSATAANQHQHQHQYAALQAHESRVSTLERSAEMRLRDMGEQHERKSTATEERLAGTIRSYEERFATMLAELTAKREESAACASAAATAGAEPCPACAACPVCDTCTSSCLERAQLVGEGAMAAKWLLQASARPDAAQPGRVDEVLISFRSRGGNQTVDAADSVRHLLIDGHGPVPGWAVAIRSMRCGERAAFLFSAPAASSGGSSAPVVGASASVVYEIELHEVTRVHDLSPDGNRTLLKTVVDVGAGAETPADGAKVKVELAVETEASTRSEMEFTLGDGTGGEGLRLTVMSMARSEVARVRMRPALVGALPLGNLSLDDAGLVSYAVWLHSFVQPRALDQMGPAELLSHVESLKAAANKRFAAGEVEAACAEYEKAARFLRLVDGEEAAVSSLKLALRLNGAACELRLQHYEVALTHSDAALALVPNSTKAMFRRGQSLDGLGRKVEAEAAYRDVLRREPASREANARLDALVAGRSGTQRA